jgi:hypothetical protein
LESVRRSHVNQFLGPEPQVSDRATSNHAPGWWVQIGDKLGSYVLSKKLSAVFHQGEDA